MLYIYIDTHAGVTLITFCGIILYLYKNRFNLYKDLLTFHMKHGLKL